MFSLIGIFSFCYFCACIYFVVAGTFSLIFAPSAFFKSENKHKAFLLFLLADALVINYDLSVATTEPNRTFFGVERYDRFFCGNDFMSGTALINSNNPYIYISVSGQGLAELRSNGTFADFISWLWSLGFCPSRFDVAYNIYDDSNVVYNTFKRAFSSPCFRSSSGLYFFRSSSKDDTRVTYRNVYNDEFYYNYVFGNHSKNMMRLYNKRIEQLQKGFSVSPNFWYRCWYRLCSIISYFQSNKC